MRFLFTQIVIVILVCIFFAALSNLTELGLTGWIMAGASGYSLYKIYIGIHNGFKPGGRKAASGLSAVLESFMFDDVTCKNTSQTGPDASLARHWEKLDH